MSTPTTPTGKRLWDSRRELLKPADILAIEAEARAQGATEERERLVADGWRPTEQTRDPERCHCGHRNASCDRDEGELSR